MSVSSTSFPIERFTLPNGLRVVLAPDPSVPVIAAVVNYDVGMRSEPEGRTGFAHLFEHLMFQGSQNLEKLAHFRYVQASGGVFNGSTHVDYTNYYETLPSNALERTLFLEADRMRAPALSEENLVNQIAVVKEEIRLQVKNRPYGGYPWCFFPGVIFDTFANAHDGYGSFADLEAATVDDARDFFNSYYAPGNAVLALAGDLNVAHTTRLVERYFGDVQARPVPQLPSFAEPDLTSERRGEHHDPMAPMPAVALAWRVPNPITEFEQYLAYVVLAEVLTDGDASRLVERLVLRDALATSVSGYLGFMGEPFAVRDPTVLILQAHYPPDVATEKILTAIEEELDRLATNGLTSGELERVTNRLVAYLVKESDAVLGRGLVIATLEQQRNRAELLNELPALLAAVTQESITAAAATLRPHRRGVLELIPGRTNG